MGKVLIKLGVLIQSIWINFQCKWNWIVSKLMFSVVSCPNKLCTCNK